MITAKFKSEEASKSLSPLAKMGRLLIPAAIIGVLCAILHIFGWTPIPVDEPSFLKEWLRVPPDVFANAFWGAFLVGAANHLAKRSEHDSDSNSSDDSDGQGAAM